jgi:gamma-glutamyltranspeptidase / glutathione hydrolase
VGTREAGQGGGFAPRPDQGATPIGTRSYGDWGRGALLALLIALPAHAASLPPTESTAGLVVSAQRLAAEVGVDMLRQGGNAIDAAVAVGYAEAVVNPCCGNIGGGGFLIAHLSDGRDIFLNFRETAPAAASRDMFLDSSGQPVHGASLFGWKAAAVPGSVLGLDTALAKYGTMSRSVVMAPAIRLARDGFALTDSDADILARGAPLLRRNPVTARIFLHPDGSPLEAGDRLVQPELAATLRSVADQGPDAFYRGHIPQEIEAAARAGGGVLTADDFAAFRVTESVPLSCTYRGHFILAAPPPASGGTVCETLNILEGFDLRGMGFHAAEAVHDMAEALRLAFFDRGAYLGDPAFINAPLSRLLSKEYATHLRSLITDRATPSDSLGPPVPPPAERTETTHFSVIDKDGGAVALTYTINGWFGAGVIAGDSGFLMNNEMDDFSLKPNVPNQYGLVQGEANAIAPGKRPLSSMAPSIVLKDGKVEMVLGSPGGPRIITATMETILNMIDHGMNAQEAVSAPRLHHQWMPDVLFAEPFALSADTETMLVKMGYHIQGQRPWGAVELIASGSLNRGKSVESVADSVVGHMPGQAVFFGANDPRRPGGAALAP